MVAKHRAEGPVVLVDAGDALSRELPAGPDAQALTRRKKAELILQLMGKMGYAAMAVGERDLVLPLPTLRAKAREAGVTLLAANLLGKDGKKPFAERKLVQAGRTKVGLFAVIEGGPGLAAHGLRASPPGEAAQKQADLLRKEGARLVVGLLHLSHEPARSLAAGLRGVDLVIVAHEGRLFAPHGAGEALVTACGERGRQLGRATIDTAGDRPLFDLSAALSAREQVVMVDAAVAQLRAQVQSSPASRSHAEGMLRYYAKRRQELLSQGQARPPPGRRTVGIALVSLDRTITEDPEYLPAVEAFRFQHPDTH